MPWPPGRSCEARRSYSEQAPHSTWVRRRECGRVRNATPRPKSAGRMASHRRRDRCCSCVEALFGSPMMFSDLVLDFGMHGHEAALLSECHAITLPIVAHQARDRAIWILRKIPPLDFLHQLCARQWPIVHYNGDDPVDLLARIACPELIFSMPTDPCSDGAQAELVGIRAVFALPRVVVSWSGSGPRQFSG